MTIGFVRKGTAFPRHGQKLASQLLRGAGQGPRQADDVARTGCGQGYPGLLVGAKDAEARGDVAADAEPEAGALHEIIQLDIALEDALGLVLGDAGAGVRGVEDVVEQHGQHLGVVDDVAGEFVLLLGRDHAVGQGQELGEAGDGVQRYLTGFP